MSSLWNLLVLGSVGERKVKWKGNGQGPWPQGISLYPKTFLGQINKYIVRIRRHQHKSTRIKKQQEQFHVLHPVTKPHSPSNKQRVSFDWACLLAQMAKNLPAMQETRIQYLSWEDPLDKGIAIHSSILARRIPWTEKTGELQSMGLQRVRRNWAIFFLWLRWTYNFRKIYLVWRRQWQPTPVLLPEKIPWTEEPARLQSMGSWRVGHDWPTSLSLFTFMHWRRKWQPTPVFLPGESQGWGSLVGCHLWGRTESDMTEAT